jgi:predicted pyridoxine 5'-phosphate oxidase superfamily flavin-nucleotide-binding protein
MKTEPWHDFIHRTVLCWLATVDAHGQPNVSPKEVFAAFDENHLVIEIESAMKAYGVRAFKVV